MTEQIDLDLGSEPLAVGASAGKGRHGVAEDASDRGDDVSGGRGGSGGDGSADGGGGGGRSDGGSGGATDGPDDSLVLADYAQRAYLEYALSVVKGRALPDVADGQKPVQRRILYAMQRMGLGWGGPRGNTPAKPVKSARVVGDVLGRFHPHGDQAAYDALVRMAQDFSQRYPLIDGHGNFGSRDGDSAAAMRYTEARLAKITHLLLDEIDEGTVDFVPNYDGSAEEPRQLPARLPFSLLNGASGIAVGLATDIPSHNLDEVARAAVALIRNPDLPPAELGAILPGPDYPGGGQIITAPEDIAAAYESGRGTLRVRARWKIESLARGQWQLVVTELPPGVSAHSVLAQIEDLTNPSPKSGKKTLSQEQTQLKASMLAVLDRVRDESSKDAPVRIVFEPKTRAVPEVELVEALLAHTGLETTVPVNLTGVGLDGKPVQKSLRELLTEWIAFRQQTITRRSQHRLNRVLDRIHILEGRQLVLLNIDEVIAIIRASDDPKAALIARFHLSEKQADDILDLRLRQLARLEAIRIERELSELRGEQERLEGILGSPAVLRRLMIREIEADAKEYGDARRTLIRADEKTTTEVRIVDEPVTVVVSTQGWVRVRQGHGHDPAIFTVKAGDTLYGTFECRSVDVLVVLGSNGRAYSVPVAQLPGGRGDGQPITTLVDLESGTSAAQYFAGAPAATLLIASSAGYGFLAAVKDLESRVRAGKSFLSVGPGEQPCRPSMVAADAHAPQPLQVVCLSVRGRGLAFDFAELRAMPKGGRGLKLMALAKDDALLGAAACTASVRVVGVDRGGAIADRTLDAHALERLQAARGRKGKALRFTFTPEWIARADPVGNGAEPAP